MKTLSIILSLLLGVSTFAYEVPKDAVIKVYTKNGKQIGQMSRAKYKVVLIEEHPCKPVIVEVPVEVPTKQPVVSESEPKNDIIVQGGIGYTGVTTTYQTGLFTVTENTGFVGSLTYCRSVDKLGLCGSVQTNKTTLLGVKFSF
jgi:hypothetical protein